MYHIFDRIFNFFFSKFLVDLRSQHPPKTIWPNFLGEPFEGVLVPLGSKMAPSPPSNPSQHRFLWFLDPNFMDFGPHLGGCWTPTWWILGFNLVDDRQAMDAQLTR